MYTNKINNVITKNHHDISFRNIRNDRMKIETKHLQHTNIQIHLKSGIHQQSSTRHSSPNHHFFEPVFIVHRSSEGYHYANVHTMSRQKGGSGAYELQSIR